MLHMFYKEGACLGSPDGERWPRFYGASLMAQWVKNLPAMQETWQEPCAGSLGWEDPLEKEMATHSSVLAWEILWTEEPGRLQSMGLLRSRSRLSDLTFTFPFRHGRRKRQPTPVFLPGESQGQGSLVSCHLWGCTELDMTEAT